MGVSKTLLREDYWKHALGDRPAFTAESYESYITENAYRHLKVPP